MSPLRSAAPRSLRFVLASALLATLVGCPAPARTLVVRVQTGLRAGHEVRQLEARLHVGAVSCREVTSPAAQAGRVIAPTDQAALVAGTMAVGSFASLAEGTYTVRVLARRPPVDPRAAPDEGEVLVSRCVVVVVRGDRVVRVPLTSDCLAVACPAPGGSPEYDQCLNGRCVDPRCDPDDPSTAPYCCDRTRLGEECDADPTLCEGPLDCAPGASCTGAPRCEGGVCVEPEGDACADGEYCARAEDRCVAEVPLPDPPDAGTTDAGAEDDAGGLDAGMDAAAAGDAGLIDASASSLDSSTTDALGPDARAALDARLADDALTLADAFAPVDALSLDALSLDARLADARALDAFTPPDAFTPRDAFTPPDAFTPRDAFTPPDAFTPRDAFTPPDAWLPPVLPGLPITTTSVGTVQITDLSISPASEVMVAGRLPAGTYTLGGVMGSSATTGGFVWSVDGAVRRTFALVGATRIDDGPVATSGSSELFVVGGASMRVQGPGCINLTATSRDAYAFQLSSTACRWALMSGGSGSDVAVDVAADALRMWALVRVAGTAFGHDVPQGAIYVFLAGSRPDLERVIQLPFLPTAMAAVGSLIYVVGDGGAIAAVEATGVSTTPLWSRTVAHPGATAADFRGVWADASGIVAVGVVRGAPDLAGGADGWIVRMDATGEPVWQSTYGGPADDGATSVASGIGGLYVGGYAVGATTHGFRSLGGAAEEGILLRLDAGGLPSGLARIADGRTVSVISITGAVSFATRTGVHRVL